MKMISVKMDSQSLETLERIAKDRGISKSEVIRRAISLFDITDKTDKHETALFEKNKALQIAVTAMNKVIEEKEKFAEALQYKADLLESTRKQQSVLYERMIDDLKLKVNQLNGVLNDKDLTIAGIRAGLDRIQRSFWYRLFA